MQSQGYENITDAANNAGTNNKISYVLDGGTLTAEKQTYTEADAGYVPPRSAKRIYLGQMESRELSGQQQVEDRIYNQVDVYPLGTIYPTE